MYFRLSALAADIYDAFGIFKNGNIRRMRAKCKVKYSRWNENSVKLCPEKCKIITKYEQKEKKNVPRTFPNYVQSKNSSLSNDARVET